MNKFNRCFTPTSLWKSLQEKGSGYYFLTISEDNVKIREVETKELK